MGTAAAPIARIADHASVIAARERLTPLVAKREALEREHADAFRIGGYRTAFVDEIAEAQTASPEEVLRARIRLQEIPRELDRVRVDEIEAARAAVEAEAMARREIAAALDARRRPLVAEVNTLLTKAAAANARLAALDDEAEQALGPGARLSFAALADETPHAQSPVGAWRRHVAAHLGGF
jgi:hypothetical protein